MDAFFASAELLRHPELAGQPVVVGGDGPRGVVAAASYEARSYGIFSAMSSAKAKRLCPDAVFLHGDHAYYATLSARIMSVVRDVTPLVEPLSLDEAFCDISGVLQGDTSPTQVATRLRQRIFDEQGLWCAVGIGPSKLIAKLASKLAKPIVGRPGNGPTPGAGVVCIPEHAQISFLHRQPVRSLWGVGPATARQLQGLGVATVGDVAALPCAVLERRIGVAAGRQIWNLAHGIDDREVVADLAPKSIGHEETYSVDLTDDKQIRTEIMRLGDATARRLHEKNLAARTITVKVRFADFQTVTRSITLSEHTESPTRIIPIACELFDRIERSDGVRLLGVSASGLTEPRGHHQLSFDELASTDRHDATDAVNAIRDRFGPDAIASATLLSKGRIGVRKRGDQQWGAKR